MAKQLFITRMSDFGTNDLIITNGKGHVIDILPHACHGVDLPLTLDSVLFAGKVYSLKTKPQRRRLTDVIRAQRAEREVRLVPVRRIKPHDISHCISDDSVNGARAHEFLKRYFDLRREVHE
jgi:hypothetical protein